jgi:hypothetical protein
MFSQDEEWDGKVTSCHKLSDHDEFELIALGLAIDADAHQQQHVGVQELAVNLSKGSEVSGTGQVRSTLHSKAVPHNSALISEIIQN